MKILLVLETDWVNRGPAQHHHLLERLQDRGHDLRVIDFDIFWPENRRFGLWAKRKVISAKGKAIGRNRTRVIRPSMIRAPLISYASFIPTFIIELIKTIKSFKPDIIIGQGVLNVFLASRISKLFGVPFVRYILDSAHTLIPETYLQPFGAWLESQGVKNCDEIFVINKQLGEYAIRMGWKTSPTVISAGIDKSRFHNEIDGNQIRERLGFRNDETVIFFMGWLYDFSGLREVANTLSKLKDTKIRLLILGKGDLSEELKQIAETTLEKESIVIHDWVAYEEVPAFVAAADICILPAHLNKTMQDIVPIKLYEYLACGKPVIATRLPGVMREFGEGSGIIYVSKPEEVVEAASLIRRNSSEHRQIGIQALSFVENLDWESITDMFEKSIKNVIENYS